MGGQASRCGTNMEADGRGRIPLSSPGRRPRKQPHCLAPRRLKRKWVGDGASRGRSEESERHVTERASARGAGLETQKNAAVGEVSDLHGSCFHVQQLTNTRRLGRPSHFCQRAKGIGETFRGAFVSIDGSDKDAKGQSCFRAPGCIFLPVPLFAFIHLRPFCYPGGGGIIYELAKMREG